MEEHQGRVLHYVGDAVFADVGTVRASITSWKRRISAWTPLLNIQ